MLVPGEGFRLWVAAPAAIGALIVAAFLAVVGLVAGPVSADAEHAAPAQSVQEELAKFGALSPGDIDDIGSPADLAPDVSLMVDIAGLAPGGSEEVGDDSGESDEQTDAAEQWWSPVREELLAQSAVAAVAVDFPAAETTVFHVRLVEPGLRRSSVGELVGELEEIVESEVADTAGPVTVTAGGRLLSDESVTNRFGTSVRWLALFALILGGYVVWRFGRLRGAIMALAWAGSVLLSARIASRVVGPFDGTIATGPLVGAMAGLLFAVLIGLRLVKWYENPMSTDGADAIQRSLAEAASDVILVLGSLVAVVGVLWITGASPRPLVAVIVGGAVGAAFTAAVVAPLFVVLGEARQRSVTLLPWSIPSAGQLLVITVLGLIGVLVVLAAFAFRSPSVDLIDYRALPADDRSRTVGDLLGAGPGDPTEALVTVVDDASPEATETWAEAVATLKNVAWVDTANRRFTGVGPQNVDQAVSLASEEQIGFESPELAVIVPGVAIRSPEGAQLIAEVTRLADERVEIHGTPGSLGRGSTLVVVATIVLLALAGAGTVLVETDNAGYALTSFVLRLLGGASTVGLYRLVSPDGSAAESIAALALVAVVVSLFELEYLHDRARFGDRWSSSAGPITVAHEASSTPPTANGSNGSGTAEPVPVENGANGSAVASDDRLEVAAESTPDGGNTPGRAALLVAVGLLAAAVWVALTRIAGGGPTAGRFGIALSVALIVEIALGLGVLRPALLGEQAVYHSVARPLRSTLHAGQRRQRNQPVSVDDPAWRRLVSDLLMAEFGLQTDPATTRVEDVFLEGTPLFGQAAEQHRSLGSSGLRVSGLAPRIKRVETHREGPSIMVSVTVDHPERHLVDQNGTVYGVRRAQRRSTMLWLVGLDTGEIRIAESIDMGSVPLDVDKTPDKTSFPEVATVSS